MAPSCCPLTQPPLMTDQPAAIASFTSRKRSVARLTASGSVDDDWPGCSSTECCATTGRAAPNGATRTSDAAVRVQIAYLADMTFSSHMSKRRTKAGTSTRERAQADFLEQARVARIQAKWIDPRLDPKPGHTVGAIRDSLAKPLIRGVRVTEADIDVTDLIGTEIAVLVRVFDLPNAPSCFVLPSGDGKNVRFERRNRRTVAELRRPPQIVDGFPEAMLLAVGQTLKGEGERRVGIEFEGLSRELDRFVIS